MVSGLQLFLFIYLPFVSGFMYLLLFFLILLVLLFIIIIFFFIFFSFAVFNLSYINWVLRRHTFVL